MPSLSLVDQGVNALVRCSPVLRTRLVLACTHLCSASLAACGARRAVLRRQKLEGKYIARLLGGRNPLPA